MTPAPPSTSTRRASYQPLVLVAAWASFGIFVDHYFDLSLFVWLTSLFIGLFAWWVFHKLARDNIASVCLLLAFSALAGFWHHHWWNQFGVDEIGLYSTDTSTPVCLEAIIVGETKQVASPSQTDFNPIPRGETTRITIAPLQIRNRQKWEPVSGTIDCWIQGQSSVLPIGTRVQIFGKIRAISKPSNPGQFDFYRHSRSQRKLAFLLVSHPAAIEVSETPNGWTFANRFRASLNDSLWRYVGPDRAPFASAILLGNREQLDRQRRDDFLVSGTVHILAISGLHVGILAGAILFLGRIGLLRRKHCLLLTIVFVIFYAWLVEFRPPVVRATILITTYCVAKWIGRRGLSFNSLALAALIVLILNPTQLLSVGAQLSFLAVGAISFFYPMFVKAPTTDPLDRLIERTRPPTVKLSKIGFTKCKNAFLVSAVVWAIAVPLVAERFHIVAPVALLVNPLLILPLTFGLLFGFGVLIFGFVFPPLATVCGWGCDNCLYLIEQLISISNTIPGNHFWTAGPGMVAVLVFYLGLVVLVFYPPTRIARRWAWASIPIWLTGFVLVPGIVELKNNSAREDLHCTFIDVGHGTSVLLELPGGKTMLYDCGSFGSSERATQNISAVLWHNRIHHIDMLVLSHADLDHYNALPGLAERFSIGAIAVSPVSIEDDADERFLETIADLKFKLKTIWLGHSISVGNDLKIGILGPPQFGTDDSDNSDSLVLKFVLRDRSLLLPGDLDGNGLEAVLATSAQRFDVAMAPHHGSRFSQPQRFIEWSNPDIFVVSGDHDDVAEETIDMLSDSGIFLAHTAFDGAIRIRFSADQVKLEHWHNGRWVEKSRD